MARTEAQERIDAELEQGERARAAGNEGMARVCARRAAGVAIREYLLATGQPVRSTSAIDLLNQVQADPALPEAVRGVAGHLLQRVTPDYHLPIQADLLAETRWLAQTLAGLAGSQPPAEQPS